ncbi:hypothetical protein [Brevibacterium sp. FME17]|nr:hypothetical protein [Brevibacterium sp. FME17]
MREPAILTERGNDALTTDELKLMTGPPQRCRIALNELLQVQGHVIA